MAGSRTSPLVPASAWVHVGRQPILDGQNRLYGYELLFRGNATATIAGAPETGAEADAATTATILSAFSEFGSQLLGGRLGFVNLTKAFLVGELPVPFPPSTGVLEVLETVEVDDDVVNGAAARVAEGHRLALDDFVYDKQWEPLLHLAEIVKIDVLDVPWEQVLETMDRCRRFNVRFLAERVEDAVTLERARDAGFQLFQGYHLGRPQTLSMERLGRGQAAALQLLSRLTDPDVTAGDVEKILRTDPALSVRLLRIANSAYTGQQQLSSLRDAVVLVGLARLRAWMVLIAAENGVGQREQVGVAMIRARTCELMAPPVSPGIRPDTAFTLGLLHGVSEVLGITSQDLVAGLPTLSDELQDALVERSGPLREVLDAVLAYEQGRFEKLPRDPKVASHLASAYLDALAWTTTTFAGVSQDR
jgi:c-di-GMP-related signal transduction protein